MKTTTTYALLALFASSVALMSQTPTPVEPTLSTNPADFGPVAGDRELILGASGGSNRDFDDSFGGISASFSQYITNTLSVGLRQSVSYTNPDSGGSAWNGSTRIAVDQHFMTGSVRPFVGLNFGRVYGDIVRDTWAAGVEAGAKFYVKPKTFLFAMAEYGWFFQHAHSVDDRFDDGQFFYSAGIGFNF